jgi:hypothetical protein
MNATTSRAGCGLILTLDVGKCNSLAAGLAQQGPWAEIGLTPVDTRRQGSTGAAGVSKNAKTPQKTGFSVIVLS